MAAADAVMTSPPPTLKLPAAAAAAQVLKQRVPQARKDGCPPDAPIVVGGKVWGSQMLRGVDGVNGLSAGVSGFLRDADVRSEQSVAPTKRRRRRRRARARGVVACRS